MNFRILRLIPTLSPSAIAVWLCTRLFLEVFTILWAIHRAGAWQVGARRGRKLFPWLFTVPAILFCKAFLYICGVIRVGQRCAGRRRVLYGAFAPLFWRYPFPSVQG